LNPYVSNKKDWDLAFHVDYPFNQNIVTGWACNLKQPTVPLKVVTQFADSSFV
jgi:hypothetical protein